jgi:hypothetical protein
MRAIYTKVETDTQITYTPKIEGETATFIINKDPDNINIRIIVPNAVSNQSIEDIIAILNANT